MIGSVGLIIGAWTLIRLMSMTIIDRKHIIEIVQTLGVQRQKALSQFVYESVLLALIGVLTGIGAGLLISALVAAVNHWQMVYPFRAIGIGVFFALFLGAGAGYFPVYHVFSQQHKSLKNVSHETK